MYKIALIIAILFCCGCGPELTKEDLGKIDHGIPDVSDIAEGYHLPDLSPDGDDSDGPTPTEDADDVSGNQDTPTPTDAGPTPVEEPSSFINP